ncbi:MAG TPA: energy transducer TonB [Gammaproteobacteria bacterium]|nr:energy transducer TonB [Gammaproteobacteria bacterium]
MLSRKIQAAAVLILGSAGSVSAQDLRCDCTSVVDTCSAEVAARGSFLEVKSNKAQCSRVDYFVDGQPFVSVVVDGEDRQPWPPRTTNPKILVQSCQVCRDNGQAPAAARPPAARAAPPADDAEKKFEPLIAAEPEYPAAARARGVQGHVDVEFTVNAAGMVENPHVVASEPRGTFDSAALAAVSRWRYPAETDRAPQTVQQRLDFKPDAARPSAAAAPRAGGAGPRNECVREDAVYNYGESVDVGLVNVCGEPLHVYGCAEGTGRYADRWLCNNTESQGDVLVAANDRRLGGHVTLATPQGARTFNYADDFVLSRAPNSQYSWIACAEQDTSCRSIAREWARSVDGQPANVDPQDRSTLALGRSY